MNGKDYSLAVNNGPNHLHGGPTGFHARVWDAEQINEQELVLRYISAYYEEGFPGELHMNVKYSLTEDDELIIDYRGTTNKKTIVNMTSHGFFSLAGIANPTPEALNNILTINADFFIPIDETSIPTGEILKVEGTPFDFRTPHAVGERIGDTSCQQIVNGTGYDHCYVTPAYKGKGVSPDPKKLFRCAVLTDPKSGRKMTMETNQEGVQVYTANWVEGIPGKNGIRMVKHGAICLESQRFPDAPNKADFPPCILKPKETYNAVTVYGFSW